MEPAPVKSEANLLLNPRTPWVYGAVSAALLVLIGFLRSAADAMLAFVGLLAAYPVIVSLISAALRPREAAARRERASAGLALRYKERLAPPGTRCAFCRCDFARTEVAAACRGCGSLIHKECVLELLSNPGPRCPNYGCTGDAPTA